jgi:hypothetical protein
MPFTVMRAPPQLCFDIMKFGSEPLTRGDATDLKLSIPALATRMRHPQRVKRLSLSPAKTPPVPVRVATKSDQA